MTSPQKKILHISADNVFFDYTIKVFEEASEDLCDYFVFTDELKHVGRLDKVSVFSTEYYNSQELSRRIREYEAVIIHCMTDDHARLVIAHPNVNFVWVVFGADVLYMKQFEGRWYTDLTKSILLTGSESFLTKCKKCFSRTFLFDIYYMLRYQKLTANRIKTKAIRQINYIAHCIPEEYDMIKETIGIDSPMLNYVIGSVEDYSLINENFRPEEKHCIQLGNSADPSNNHADILYMLKEINYNGEIICPLSYGNVDYAKNIKRLGIKLFGSKFIPLTKFISLEEYNSYMSRCDIVVMNHLRQQALGNIKVSLWLGKKIFLNQQNYIKSYFDRIDLKVYSIEEDLTRYVLSEYDNVENIEMSIQKGKLEEYYGYSNIVCQVKKMINTLTL